MMYRRSSSTPEEQELLDARRRFLLAQASGSGGGGGGGPGEGMGMGEGAQQQQQLNMLREQQILLEARAAALAGHPQQQQQQQQQQAQQLMSNAALQQHQQHQQQQQQQHWNSSSSLSLGNSNGNESAAFQDQRFSHLQRAQLEVHRHAQAQAQAEARMKALLADHEAQVVQDQLRLQLRQGRLNTPPSASTLSANAYDMLSSGAAGGAGGGRSSLSLPGGSAAAAAVAAEAGNSRASLEGASLSSAALLLQQQQQQSPASQRARMLGLGGSQPQSQHGSLLRANGTASSGGMNNVILPNGLREESMFFGKISRETSAAAAAVDVALDVQSRQGGNKKYDDGRGGNENSKLDDDHPSASLRDSSNSAAAATANAAEGVGEEPEEEDEEDRLDDDEYFRRHHPPASGDNAGSSNEAGGNSYPMAREAFPLKLYRILYEAEQNEQDDIISFFPHGRAFAVHKSKEFTRDIMPKYFPAGRMNTFLKQLNLYGFRRITEGRDKGGYFHKDFLKGKRHMCKKIKRKKVHVNKAPPPTPAQHAPAFFSHPSFGRMGASNLPFLDQLSSTFGSSSNLSQQQQLLQHQQQLLQQQQQQQQQLLSGLQLSGSASNAASMFGNAAFNRERLLLASSSTENVAQNYMQDLSSPSSVNNSARLHPANFQNFNGNNHPNLR